MVAPLATRRRVTIPARAGCQGAAVTGSAPLRGDDGASTCVEGGKGVRHETAGARGTSSATVFTTFDPIGDFLRRPGADDKTPPTSPTLSQRRNTAFGGCRIAMPDE